MPSGSDTPAGVGALLAAYAAGAVTPRAAVHAAAAAARSDDAGAWLAVAEPAALDAQLAALDERDNATELPLYGVPFAVKDNIDVAGMPTTAACPAFKREPAESAEAVRRLCRAGAVVIGKLNLDQFATGLVGTRSPYGAVVCGMDKEYVGGGSSSGSAAAVALGHVQFALGTDTAGSGRVPAAFQNVVGLKPTPGRVSTHGVVPACRSLDCVSVFALTASDAARVLAVMEDVGAPSAGPGVEPEPELHPSPTPLGPAELSRPRFGVPAALVADMSSEYRVAFEAAVARVAADFDVKQVDFAPLHAVASLLYDGPWVAERRVVLADLLARDPDSVQPVVRDIVCNAASITACDVFEGRYRLGVLAREARRMWNEVDVIMVPTAPLHPTLAEVAEDPIGVNSKLGGYTNFVNLLGWCALALPAAVLPGVGGACDRPFGITWIAPAGYDAALAALGARWQELSGSSVPFGCPSAGLRNAHVAAPPPAACPASEPVLRLAVVGAHLTGMPLHYQMEERRARLLETTKTAAAYRLYALKGTTPKKPGLVRVAEGGVEIELQVYALPMAAVGSFLALIPSPLGLGSVELGDGRIVHSFICEPCAIEGATDVSEFGGWRSYIQSLSK